VNAIFDMDDSDNDDDNDAARKQPNVITICKDAKTKEKKEDVQKM